MRITALGLKDTYYDYLQCLDERRWNDLGEVVSSERTNNQQPMSLDDYRAMLQGDAGNARPALRRRTRCLRGR
jgi:predicted ester cyclase